MPSSPQSDHANAEIYASSGFYLDGEWRFPDDARLLDVIDPATEDSLGAIPIARPGDVEAAIESAHAAFPGWRRSHPWDRAAILKATASWLRSRSEECARVLSLEQGKPVAEAVREIGMAADHFEWAAEEAKRLSAQVYGARPAGTETLLERQPIGVVAAFTPWNFPALQIAAKVGCAIAAGCTIVLKPSEEVPGIAILMARALHEAGAPKGVFNLVFGEPSQISRQLIASPKIKGVSFTGSTRVGRLLAEMAASSFKRLTLELGGHAPVIVYPDFDPKDAAIQAATAKFRNGGQACVSPSRFFVHESIADAFTAHFVDFANSLVVGAGVDPATTMGPLVNRNRVEAAKALVSDALERGARLHCGGVVPAGRNRGFFFEPTVLSDVSLDSRIMREEPFAPIAPIVRFSGDDEALRMANDVEYGLGGYVFSNDAARASITAAGLDVGMVGINNLALAGAEMPFGGVKNSGYGREGGPHALDEYLQTKFTKRPAQGR